MQPDGSWYPGFPLPDWIRFGRKGRMARPGAGDPGNCYSFNTRRGCRHGDTCYYAHNYNYKTVTAYGLRGYLTYQRSSWKRRCAVCGVSVTQKSAHHEDPDCPNYFCSPEHYLLGKDRWAYAISARMKEESTLPPPQKKQRSEPALPEVAEEVPVDGEGNPLYSPTDDGREENPWERCD